MVNLKYYRPHIGSVSTLSDVTNLTSESVEFGPCLRQNQTEICPRSFIRIGRSTVVQLAMSSATNLETGYWRVTSRALQSPKLNSRVFSNDVWGTLCVQNSLLCVGTERGTPHPANLPLLDQVQNSGEIHIR